MAIRTYGLSGSGMDVDQMVKDLMKAQRARYDTIIQKKTQLEWKKADYNTMYTAINDFRSNTAFNYKLQSTLIPKKAASSNETIVTVSANADAVNFTHSVDVIALAKSASMSSSAAISQSSDASKANLQDHIGVSGSFNLTLNDGTTEKSLTNYDTTGKSIYDFVSDINKLGLNIKASYDSTLDRFFLYNTKSGEDSQISLSSDGSADDLVAKLNLGNSTANISTDPSAINKPLKYTSGASAEVEIDGANMKLSSNTVTVSGITYNFKAEGAANVIISSDTDKAVAAVKSFIESYNSTLSKINNETSEVYYKDFLPLTDAQKAEMKESDIKAWEVKAKSGLLRRNPILQDLAMKMRNDLASPIAGLTGKYTSAASIGITSGTYSEGGKLYLDETKLRTALEDDPEILNKLFGTNGETNSQSGIATRLYNTFQEASEKVVTEAGVTTSTDADTKSNLAKQIAEYNKQMTALNSRLQDTEDRYYAQFNAMETALQKLSQQSSWLAQQFSS